VQNSPLRSFKQRRAVFDGPFSVLYVDYVNNLPCLRIDHEDRVVVGQYVFVAAIIRRDFDNDGRQIIEHHGPWNDCPNIDAEINLSRSDVPLYDSLLDDRLLLRLQLSACFALLRFAAAAGFLRALLILVGRRILVVRVGCVAFIGLITLLKIILCGLTSATLLLLTSLIFSIFALVGLAGLLPRIFTLVRLAALGALAFLWLFCFITLRLLLLLRRA
jgi:hypothetical protein